MTEERHEYTRISYLKTRKWRCPNCYRRWKEADPRLRGQHFSCQVPRCRTGWLAPEQACEVIDLVTEAVYIMCPNCYSRWAPARDRQQSQMEAVKESAYKDGFRDGSIQKPISVTVPMNPDAVRNIAATLAVIAPDFTAEECTSVAQSFFDMVIPQAVAAMDPGDAGPKAFDPYAAGRIGNWEGLLIDHLSAAEHHGGPGLREQYQRAFGGKCSGIKAGDLISDTFDRADGGLWGGGSWSIHATYSETFDRRLKLDRDGPLIPLLGDAYDPTTGDVDYAKLRPQP